MTYVYLNIKYTLIVNHKLLILLYDEFLLSFLAELLDRFFLLRISTLRAMESETMARSPLSLKRPLIYHNKLQ